MYDIYIYIGFRVWDLNLFIISIDPKLRIPNLHTSIPTTTCRLGFISAVRSTLKLGQGGLLTAGIPCGSYVFINSATSGRRAATPLGNEQRQYVSAANTSLALEFGEAESSYIRKLF